MFKSTINKVFQKEFPNNIWKIEVDTFCNYLGIETRDVHTTIPQYTVLDFDGHIIMEKYSPSARDWMLEGIQKGLVILKKVGENTPIKEGIQVIHAISGQEVFTSYEYQLLDVYEDFIKVRHRSVISGNDQFIHIKDGMLRSMHEIDTELLPPESGRISCYIPFKTKNIIYGKFHGPYLVKQNQRLLYLVLSSTTTERILFNIDIK